MKKNIIITSICIVLIIGGISFYKYKKANTPQSNIPQIENNPWAIELKTNIEQIEIEEKIKQSIPLEQMEQENEEKALQDYTSLIANATGDKLYNAYLDRWFFYHKQREYENAIQDFSKAISLNPTSTGYTARWLLYYSLEENEKALYDINHAIEYTPKIMLYMLRWVLYEELWEHEAYIRNISAITKLDANDSIEYEMRGISYLIKGEEDNDATLLNKAIQDFSKSITLNSGTDPYVSYHWRGRAYELLENYEYAIKDYTKAITLASGRTEKKDSYIGLFSAHLWLEDFKNALDDMNNLLELDPTNELYLEYRENIINIIKGQKI